MDKHKLSPFCSKCAIDQQSVISPILLDLFIDKSWWECVAGRFRKGCIVTSLFSAGSRERLERKQCYEVLLCSGKRHLILRQVQGIVSPVASPS